MVVRTKRRAFTLIELMTVIAITAVLLGIIIIPVIQSFNLTRAAQGLANAQDRARSVISRIERDISNSAGVRDNSGSKGSLYVMLPNNAGVNVPLMLSYVKLDVQAPAQGDPASRVGTAYIDPDTGKVDPTLTTPKGQVRLPGVPGNSIVRYFICRRDPFAVYNNPWVQYKLPGGGANWLQQGNGQDNLYVLMRAEVEPYVYQTIAGVPTRVVNSAYFYDLDRDADPNTSGPLLDDATFMDPLARNALGGSAALGYSLAQPYDPADRDVMVRNWLSKASIVTEVSRYDMIMPVINKQNQQVQFDGANPVIIPMVRFQPTRLNSEAAEAQLAVRPNEETDNSEKIGSTIYKTQMGQWSDARMRIWASVYAPATGPLGASAGAVRPAWGGGNTLDMMPNAAGENAIFGPGGELINIDRYRTLKNSGADYPFTRSLNLALLTGSPLDRQEFIAMVPDPTSGLIDAGFDIRDYGVDVAVPYDARVPSNTTTDPGVEIGATVTPANATYQAGPNWHTFFGLNEKYARLYHQWDSLWPNVALAPARDDAANGVKRFIDLRVLPQAGASAEPSPLSPGLFARAAITPGSEVVYGPDQNPGPNYGEIVRYSRVPNIDSIQVGANQYKINYTDRREPDWAAQYGFGGVNYDKAFYDATSFLSSVLQARYRAGYIELNSKYGEPIPGDDAILPAGPKPNGNIYVTYSFQFTEPNDVVSVDYGSTELMEVVLSIRNYPQTNLPPQLVTVRGTAAVRNKLR
jgi:prepilin-type N-terminal cleavage/methylation domain-containing protein